MKRRHWFCAGAARPWWSAFLNRASKRPQLPVKRALRIETLEVRAMMAGQALTEVRTYDGVGNNLLNVDWGSTNEDLLRIAAAEYSDGVSTPAGVTRISARALSNLLAAHPDEAIKNDRALSNFVYAWGQFIDHDIDLTNSASPRQAFGIVVPTGDPQFDPNGTGTQIIPLSRSEFDAATGTSAGNPRQQVNSITAYIDGSQVYGSDAVRAAALRTMSDGRLKTSDGNLLPLNATGLANANDSHRTADDQLFVAGDVRSNENIELTSLHVLFMREHNRLADSLAKVHPNWTDEQLYQAARRQVVGEIQAITYNEFLPALLGPAAMQRYKGYDPNVNPGVTTEFSTAAFRFGHSMLGNDVEFFDDDGEEVRDEISLADAFFNPNLVKETGIDPLLKYLASDQAEEIDLKVVDSLRNLLFGLPGQGGFDLASLNIQRGRDHGLADYNATRAALGLAKATSFADLTDDVAVQQQLAAAYSSVDDVDLWVGGLAEDHIPGGSVGETFAKIIADQFQRLRAGDRLWYQNSMRGSELARVDGTKLTDVIRRNTGLTNLQSNAFVFQATIKGNVFVDFNQNSRQDRNEFGVAGRTVELLGSAGTVLAATTTDRRGNYRFQNLDLGSYTVRATSSKGTTTTSPAISITRGMIVGQNLGEAPLSPVTPPSGWPGGWTGNGSTRHRPPRRNFA